MSFIRLNEHPSSESRIAGGYKTGEENTTDHQTHALFDFKQIICSFSISILFSDGMNNAYPFP